VTKVDGGTGLFTADLPERVPWIELTVAEPSPPMMEAAAAGQALGANLVHEPLDGELRGGLAEQRLFLFQRSLNSLHGGLSPYRARARSAERTVPGGHSAIYGMPGPYDKELDWAEDSASHQTMEVTEEVLLGPWPVIEAALREFKSPILEGGYALFDRALLDDVFGGAGSNCTHQQSVTFVHTKG
jgi:hypothetical protein